MPSSRLVAILGLALTTGACSSDVNPIKAAFVEAGYGPKAVATPDFVEKSRTSDGTYMPVGVSAPKRIRARSADARKSLESELESARGRNEARGKAAEGAGKGTGKGLSPPAVPGE